MKQIILSVSIFALMFAAACSNGGNQPANNNTADTTAKVETEKVIAPPSIPESETYYDFDPQYIL